MTTDIHFAFSTFDGRPPPGLVSAFSRPIAIRGVVAFVRQFVAVFAKTCSAVAIDAAGPMLQALHQESLGSVSPASRDLMLRFQNTVVPHLDAAYNFARFLSRDADAAQDIVQEAFLRAYRNFDGYRGGEPRAWMFAIVRNCYYVWLSEGRRKARYETAMMASEAKDDDQPYADAHDVASEEDSPEAALIRKTESLRVRQVVNSLPDLSREVLVLRELENLSYRQIADITDVPIGTVMSRLARARREFGEAWQLGEKGGVA
ncbi:sigma-70 family RNA polymerase sigma factor [Rhizobium mayense]|uniref:Sigma-70 family RNA polymerase sigma factor n=1 Tax=Rhizobium mayense TaxID=1312184 RepID=A0ABT7JWQ1_9HYPH|nr:sigma-70 family RNA polymerase sigma factor [Rhizobium mayense]MDL2400736.1 sigma-70 family RNA polymerase sigma factor [Rhizobium mayense]